MNAGVNDTIKRAQGSNYRRNFTVIEIQWRVMD